MGFLPSLSGPFLWLLSSFFSDPLYRAGATLSHLFSYFKEPLAVLFVPCSIVLHFGVGPRPFRDMPLYSKGRSTSVAARGRLA